jgi:hypothetical protein
MKIFIFNLKNFHLYFVLLTCLIISTSTNKLNLESLISKFNSKSIFFSSLNTESFSIDNYKLENEAHKPHKTDTVIIKLESSQEQNLDATNIISNQKNFLSIKISHQFYKILSCFQKEADLAQNKKVEYDYEKIFRNFAKISPSKGEDNFLTCFQRQDYFDKTFTRKKNNFHIDLLNQSDQSFYSTEEMKLKDYYANFDIKNYIDINISEYTQAVKNFFSDFIMWNDHSYFELFFNYNQTDKKFKLTKIFIYFSYPPYMIKDLEKSGKYYFVTLIKNGLRTFDNIFIYYKSTQKIMKYTKNFKSSDKEKLTISDFNENLLNYETKVKTRKSDSIFHNTLTVTYTENLFQNFIKKLQGPTQTKLQEICFFVYQHLTEDTYVEKNEFKNYLENKYKKNKINYMFSSFIDQELSSDLSDQYFSSFVLCDEIENFKSDDEFEISYPIHFRYQPSISSDSSSTHQNAVMPHPYIELFTKNNTVSVPDLQIILLEEYFSKQNILDKDPYFTRIKREGGSKIDLFDERRIFSEEIKMKLKFVINDYNFYFSNREILIHQIPAGIGRHFWLVVILTTLFTAIGFFIILYGLIVYSVSGLVKNKVEIKDSK